jgi:ferredoxin
MSTAAESEKTYVAQLVEKSEPLSKGLSTPRKKVPKILAIINDCCTGCAGSPACVDYCPVSECMYWIPDVDHPPFGIIEVDPMLCIGCKLCASKGPDGSFLEGCPWDAIDMVPTAEWEAVHGKLPS